MREPARVVADVRADAPADDVWALLTAWERHHEWMFATHMRDTGGAATAVGSELSATTGWGRLAFTDTMRVTTWDPPRRCVVEHTGKLVRGTGVFEVVALPTGGCRVIWSEALKLPFGVVGRLGWPLVRPVAVAGLRFSLRRLARQAAAPHHP